MTDMVEVSTSDGLRYFVDPTDERAQVLIETDGEFNAKSVRIFQQLLTRRTWDLVLDIGSNYGEMIAALRGYPTTTAIAFEPNPALHPFLQRTATANAVDLDIRAQAVGRTPGHAQFMIDQQWSGKSSLKGISGALPEHLLDVEVTSLDELFGNAQYTNALIKIDVEGAEYDVLNGALEFISGLDDFAIQFEILHMPLDEIAALAARWKMYLFSTQTLAPVRLPGPDAQLADLYLKSHRFYQNDAVLLPQHATPLD